MSESLFRIKETDMDNFSGKTVDLIVDFGKRVSSMERGFIFLMMGE